MHTLLRYGLTAVGAVVAFVALMIAKFVFGQWRIWKRMDSVPGKGGDQTAIFYKEGFHVSLARLHEELGPLFKARLMQIPIVCTASPDDYRTVLKTENSSVKKDQFWELYEDILGKGLVTSGGSHWASHRALLDPAFSFRPLLAMQRHMIERSRFLADCLGEIEEGTEVDIADWCNRYALDVVGRTAFNYDMRALEGERSINDAFSEVLEIKYDMGLSWSKLITGLMPWSKAARDVKAGIRTMTDFYDRMRQENEARINAETGGADDNDDAVGSSIIDILLRAQRNPEPGTKAITDRDIRDECMTFLFAGHETSSNALSFAFHLLSTHPEEQAKVHAELDEVLGGNEPTPETLGSLVHLSNVITETLRLFPPAYLISRELKRDLVLSGHTIPQGVTVLLSLCRTFRDPAYHKEPNSFRPDRFNKDSPLYSKVSHYAMVPFSAGPRNCIGQKMATAEMKLLLAVVLQRFSVTAAPGHDVVAVPTFTLQPADGVKILLHPRP